MLSETVKSLAQQTPRNRFNNNLCLHKLLKRKETGIYITECPFKQINVKVNSQGQITVKANKTHLGRRSITPRIFQNNGFSAHIKLAATAKYYEFINQNPSL